MLQIGTVLLHRLSGTNPDPACHAFVARHDLDLAEFHELPAICAQQVVATGAIVSDFMPHEDKVARERRECHGDFIDEKLRARLYLRRGELKLKGWFRQPGRSSGCSPHDSIRRSHSDARRLKAMCWHGMDCLLDEAEDVTQSQQPSTACQD
jgi:hypothetical protein